MPADTKTREADFASPFAQTPEAIPGESCDQCGKAVPARYMAEKEGLRLTFCAHHIRKFAAGLRADGFVITPDDIDYAYNPNKVAAAAVPAAK